ncbi:MAG: hypothetical protein CO013_07580 [Syntrophobacterales bacterium CG_4_8_14_3_um_filter_58_8]|nr:MAG: hypothetical protein CO013_07580 [Syntrophobacterales bacterium CG_4_8_14_3_um_filter_58_8]
MGFIDRKKMQQVIEDAPRSSYREYLERIFHEEHKLVAVAAETSGNTIAIQGLNHKVDDLTAETRGNTVAIRDLSAKLDGVAADLAAHRRDTEAHPPVYRVKEFKDPQKGLGRNYCGYKALSKVIFRTAKLLPPAKTLNLKTPNLDHA